MNELIKSPLNYTGGKYKLLNSILPQFPKKIHRFADLFAGGLNVGINADADIIYANDQITYLIDLYQYFQDTDTEILLNAVHERIADFSLSQTNAEGYNALRAEYNKTKSSLDLFVLICYAFNHQIRFNSRHEFNTPFGKERSSFNASIERNLKQFCGALRQKKIILSGKDFRNFDFSAFQANDVVYCDPPYLITNGSYTDGKRGFTEWTESEERDLLKLLDDFNEKGILFFLSNVLEHKGLSNDLLIRWSERYHVIYLDKNYSNCSYHFKDRSAKTVEVLITNQKEK